MGWESNGISWKAETIYVDIDTGDILTKRDATNPDKYLIIKRTKYETRINTNHTRGILRWLTHCRKQPQSKFNFG